MADLVIAAANVVAGAGSTSESVTIGETVTAGKIMYSDPIDGRWRMADSNSATPAVRTAQGIALNGGSTGQPARVLREGPITIGATLSPGVAYYLSDTPGGICPVADLAVGEFPTIIGIAISATVLDVKFHSSGVSL